MKELLDRLSSYNLFNYLLPGTIFVAMAQRITDHKFDQDSTIVSLFLYYFIGLVVSRVGSLIVDPLLKNSKFIKFAEYKEYIRACSKDPKIELLSEQNNSYRTLCALFVMLPALKVVDMAVAQLDVSGPVALSLGSLVLFILFAFAYRRQTDFIRKRVEVATK